MNYYDILGVDRNATDDDIKRAYRKLAAKHHPDRGGSTAKFQEIQQAYDNLSDPQKRAAHDSPQHHFGGSPFHFNAGPNLNDIFDRMFRQQHEPVFRTTLWVTLEQVLTGGEETLKLQTPNGQQFIKVQIPRGVLDGAQQRFNVLTNAALLVEFRTQQHLRFVRSGPNLVYKHRISVLQLITGATFQLDTLTGSTLEVKVPPYTQPDTTLKISGAGLPHMNSSMMGDMFINLEPYVPTNIPQSVLDSIATVE